MHVLFAASAVLPLVGAAVAAPSDVWALHTRSRKAAEPGAGPKVVEEAVRWDPRKTAVIVCDMWDTHWCKGAAARVDELAPVMDGVIAATRKRGALIIHAPSDTLAFYEGTPQRKRAQEAPFATPPTAPQGWHSLDATKEPPLPIDDSDGGCDDEPQCKQGPPWPWKRQHAAIEIAPEDAITQDGQEVYNLLRARGIDHVLMMGVHTNMCVLGRPFGIRRMVSLGLHVLLVRDMTDTMYNSRMRPRLSHFRGTDLVVQHIETHWCPTITSTDLTGKPAFRFRGDDGR